MADLIAVLTNAASSLAAQRAAAATASHNLENANTPGYSRQLASLEATLPAERVGNAYIGRGARLQTVTQARDKFLEAQIPAQWGLSSQASTLASALESVSALNPDQVGGLGDAISNYFTSLRQLSQNPSDSGLRQSAVLAASSMAQTFQRTRSSIEAARTGLDARLAGSLGEVNDLASQVADLNGQIRSARASGAEPNDLLDARQKAVDRLAELAGVAQVPTSDGDISLFLPGGSPLVSSLAAGKLSALADATNGGHLALTLSAPGGGTAALMGVGGELSGLLEARDGSLKSAVTSLDTLAFDLATTTNTIHRAGNGLTVGSTNLDLFTVSAINSASTLVVNASILADPRLLATSAVANTPGDAANLQRMLGVEGTALSGGLTVTDAFAAITTSFGGAARSASALASHHAALRQNLEAMRDSVSGVSVDEELINMQKAQKAFEAISKVIQTSSDMFDTLLQLK